jgi:hypothetical protein
MTEVDDLQHVGVFRPTTEPSLGWGVVGTGWIAEQFVTGTQRHTPQRIVAVGSRSAGRSAAFAARHGVEHSHESYSALIDDPAVDAVYIASARSMPPAPNSPPLRIPSQLGFPRFDGQG